MTEGMLKSETQWLTQRMAVGPVRKGRRGWFVLGDRPPDGKPAPIIAHGSVDTAGVTVAAGVLAPDLRAMLEKVAR